MTVPVCLETASTILTDCIAVSSGIIGIYELFGTLLGNRGMVSCRGERKR